MNKEFYKMQKLAGLITESQIIENQNDFFQSLKNFVIDYLQESDQDVDVSNAQSFDELKQIIDDYWGWEDEQTLLMLDKFIKSYYDKDQIIGMLEREIRNNL
jgi:hypothetical protein